LVLEPQAQAGQIRILFRIVALFIRPGEFDTFQPDVILEDQQNLSGYGLEATVLHLPGHTKGSIGILTADRPSSAAT